MKTNIFTYVQTSVHFVWCLVFSSPVCTPVSTGRAIAVTMASMSASVLLRTYKFWLKFLKACTS